MVRREQWPWEIVVLRMLSRVISAESRISLSRCGNIF